MRRSVRSFRRLRIKLIVAAGSGQFGLAEQTKVGSHGTVYVPWAFLTNPTAQRSCRDYLLEAKMIQDFLEVSAEPVA